MPQPTETNNAAENPLVSAWRATASRNARSPALLAPNGRTLRTFEEVEHEAREFAAMLDAVPPRRVLAIRLPNHPGWPGTLLAAWRNDCVVLPVDAASRPESLEPLYDACGVAAEFTSGEGGGVALRIRDARAPAFPELSTNLLKLTSGTTSAPRAIRFRARQLMADAVSIHASMGIGPGDTSLGVIPFSHSYGFSHLVTPLLLHGIPVAVAPDPLPAAIRHALEHTRSTVFPGIPLHFRALSESVDALPDSLRLCISAGAPLDEATATQFHTRFGRKIHSFYGASEAGAICYDDTDTPWVAPGFVGTPMQGVTLDWLDPDSGPPRQPVISSPAVGDGIYPEYEHAEVRDGKFTPSDLLAALPEGYAIVGRVSDFINVGARKVNPQRVENALRQIPGIRDAAVFGHPPNSDSQRVAACIECGASPDDREIANILNASLQPWECPRHYWRVPSLPRNARGKVSRKSLADWF